MGQHHPARPGPPAEAHRVLGGSVAERRFRGDLRGQQEAVVDQHVGVVGQVERGLVVLAPAVRARAELGRAVVGEVGETACPSLTR